MMYTTLLLLIAATATVSEKNPSVILSNLGRIEGRWRESLNGRKFFSFEGVPYAQPPVGDQRFKAPISVKPWVGTWEAKTIYKCMQWNQFTPPGGDYLIGEEDCLYLNIYTPNLDSKANLDVIVFFHGGAFMFGEGGSFGPDYLLDKNVVFINLNYRLGPLGFLSTENDILPGNNGMKDQIFALKFIQNYVKSFGGNPDSVTIVGMSAGGASVHFHSLSPKSRGLFHQGWSMSGTMLDPWVLVEAPLEKTKKLAAGLGCSTQNLQSMVRCLKNRPARQIVESVKDFQPWLYNPFSPFGLVVDSWASDPVLPEHPYILLKKKQVYDVPWIASYTNSEGLYPVADFYKDEQYLKDIDTRWNEIIPQVLDYNYTVDPKLHDEVSQKIRRHYLNETRVSRKTFKDFIPIVSDRIFIIDIQKTARLHAAATKSPIYSYLFTYRGAHSLSEFRGGTTEDFGASHADDTAYVFRIDTIDTTTTQNDKKMIKLMTDLMISFAKTGQPKVPIKWPTVPKTFKEPYTFLQIDGPDKLCVGTGINANTQFWNSLPIIENEKLFLRNKNTSSNASNK